MSSIDAYASDYDAALDQGLKLTGEPKEYFAAHRIDWLKQRLLGRDAEVRSALDFGCGTGTSCCYLWQGFGLRHYMGYDPSAHSIQQARAGVSFPGARFESTPETVPAEAFDLAFTNGVFHHIPPAERAGAVEYLQASMAAGGWFALWENNPWNPGTRLVMSRIPFDRDAITLTPPEARALLRAGGLTPRRTDALFIFPHALRALRFVEPWLASLPLGAQYLVLAQRPA